MYECCDKATALNGIVESVERNVSAEEVESVLQSLIADKLMLGVNSRYLSLAIPQAGSHKRLTKSRPIGNFRHASLGTYARRVAKLRDPRAALGLVARTVHRMSQGGDYGAALEDFIPPGENLFPNPSG